MAPKKFVLDPVSFGDPDGICSLVMAKAAGIRYSDEDEVDELLPLVVSGTPPGPSKVKLQFGHQVTKSISKHHGASSPFFSPTTVLNSALKSELAAWNPVPVATADFDISRLHLLRSSPIGGLLLVLHHWDPSTQAFGTPVLRVVACPAVATLGSFSVADPPGFNLQEIWDSTDAPISEFPHSDLSCPILVSSTGTSRRAHPPTVENLLKSTAPLFIPNGETVASTVTVATATAPHLRAFYLPRLAHLPIGLTWKLSNLTIDLMVKSVHNLTVLAPSLSPYAPFLYLLKLLVPTLPAWLLAVQTDPTLFSFPAVYLADLQSHFPDLVSGAFPSTIPCSISFAPLMDMRHLYAWRLLVDKILSGISTQDIQFFTLFLSRAAKCLHSDSYVGVELLPELMPNMSLHFKSACGWPTGQPPFADFSRPEVCSPIAQNYQTISIEVQATRPDPSPDTKLITVSAASALRHLLSTPRISRVPADLPPLASTPIPIPKTPDPFLPPVPTPPPVPVSYLPPGNLLSPPPTGRHQPATPSGRRLFSTAIYSPSITPPSRPPVSTLYRDMASASAAPSGPPPASLQLIPTAPKWPECMTWSIATASARLLCAPEFLSLPPLLCHGPKAFNLTSSSTYRPHQVDPNSSEYCLFARPAQLLFRARVLLPMYSTPPGSVDAARIFLQGMLDAQGENYFQTFFTHSFFEAKLLKLLILPSSWDMAETFDPTLCNGNHSFNVYNFLPCLKTHARQPALLPTNGIPILELQPLSQFILAWFRGMDWQHGATSSKFDSSLLGTRLRYLAALLSQHTVQVLWATAQRECTFVWFHSLRSLLHLFQRLCASLAWQADTGFLSASAHVTLNPELRDSQHFLDLLRRYDADLQDQWRPGRLVSSQSLISSSTIPPNHFQRTRLNFTPATVPLTTTSSRSQPTTSQQPASRTKRDIAALSDDFTAVHPLLDIVGPAPNHRGIVMTTFLKACPVGQKMPQLPGPDGKSALICFPSSVAAPYNTCCTTTCRDNQSRRAKDPRGSTPFLHIDLAQPSWKNKPEAYWAPLVQFLQSPGVSASISPSSYLRALTPSTPW